MGEGIRRYRKDCRGIGIDSTLQVMKPHTISGKRAVESAAESGEVSFKTRLENAMLSQAQLTSDAIMSVAMSIDENSEYGAQFLERLRRRNPHARAGKMSDPELEIVAKAMIQEDINEHRRKWANDWLYFGNDPGTTDGVAESIELEIWGLWILNEELKHEKGLIDIFQGAWLVNRLGG